MLGSMFGFVCLFALDNNGMHRPISGLACGLPTIASKSRYMVCLVAIATFQGEGSNLLGFFLVTSHLHKFRF